MTHPVAPTPVETLRAAAALKWAHDGAGDNVASLWDETAAWFDADWHASTCRPCQATLAQAMAYLKENADD